MVKPSMLATLKSFQFQLFLKVKPEPSSPLKHRGEELWGMLSQAPSFRGRRD